VVIPGASVDIRLTFICELPADQIFGIFREIPIFVYQLFSGESLMKYGETNENQENRNTFSFFCGLFELWINIRIHHRVVQ